MKKIFSEAEVEITLLSAIDIITFSAGGDLGGDIESDWDGWQ